MSFSLWVSVVGTHKVIALSVQRYEDEVKDEDSSQLFSHAVCGRLLKFVLQSSSHQLSFDFCDNIDV